MSIDKTLKERGDRYGTWTGNAEKAQVLKDVLREFEEWKHLEDIHKEALDMIMVKIGRILNGDPNYIDNWHDIIGFARLVEKELEDREEENNAIVDAALRVLNRPVVWELEPMALEPEKPLAEPEIKYEDYAPFATKL